MLYRDSRTITTTITIVRQMSFRAINFGWSKVWEKFQQLQALIRELRDDELEHLDTAVDNHSQRAPAHALLTAIVEAGCGVAIKICQLYYPCVPSRFAFHHFMFILSSISCSSSEYSWNIAVRTLNPNKHQKCEKLKLYLYMYMYLQNNIKNVIGVGKFEYP